MAVLKKSSLVFVTHQDDQIIKKIKWKNEKDEIMKKIVFNELEAWQNIKSDFVPNFLGYNISLNEFYIIFYTKYINGLTLNKSNNFNKWIIIPQLVQGLKNIFDSGFCHGDIKPENIIYSDEENKIYYIDFGFSCKINPLSDSGKYYRGSIPYLYPPILLGKIKSDEFTSEILMRNDIYALANVFHYILTGHTIYKISKEDNRMQYIKKIETTTPTIETNILEFDLLIYLMINTNISIQMISNITDYICKKYVNLK
jgi:serine/threonine protein kinase